jgi:TRAP-type transport system periplasmic protein
MPDDIKAKVSAGFNESAIRQREALTKLNDDLADTLQRHWSLG